MLVPVMRVPGSQRCHREDSSFGELRGLGAARRVPAARTIAMGATVEGVPME